MSPVSVQHELLQHAVKERQWSTAVAAVISSGPAFLLGVTLGFPSLLLGTFDLSSTQADNFGALAPVGALFGSFIAGYITEVIGRKGSLLLVMIPYTLGYLVLTYSQYLTDYTILLAVLYIGRFLTGIGLGWSALIVPVYHAEISSAKLRGLFASFTQLFLSIGLFVVYSLGTIPGLKYYHATLIITGILVIFAAFILLIPESPRWLIAKSRLNESKTVLRYLRGPNYLFEPEIKSIEQDIVSTPRGSRFKLFKHYICNSRRMKPLVSLLIVMFLQQMSGLNAGTAYATVVFQEAGVSDPSVTASFVVGGTSVVFTLISIFVVDYFGRKILLILSGIGMLIGIIMLGTHFYVTRPSLCNITTSDNTDIVCNGHIAPLAITGLVIFYSTFSIGWGPVPWILLGELIPLNIRGFVGSLATFVNWGTAAIVTGFYFNYSELVNSWFSWWTFSFFNGFAVIFVLLFIEETKGKSLEQASQHQHS